MYLAIYERFAVVAGLKHTLMYHYISTKEGIADQLNKYIEYYPNMGVRLIEVVLVSETGANLLSEVKLMALNKRREGSLPGREA